jgi:hypothetical protein
MEPEIKVNVDNVFAYNIMLYVISDNKDNGLKMVDKENICNWKEKILVKSNSLCKVKLFRLVICTLEGVKLIIYIYIYIYIMLTHA